MENKYDVTVIIPIYNCENYIEDCVNSIINQEYENKEKIQIILVNDGSIDNSLNICNELANKNSNILVISQENQGVSSARNNAIKSAEGKYIMYMDADDWISKNTIRNLVEFFDNHFEEVDLVVYPRYEYNMITKKTKKLQRYEKLSEQRVYDIYENEDTIQPTLNVIIKNKFKDNILFDTNLFFHEDLLYLTEIVMHQKKLGYVNKAKYYYRIYDNSVTNHKENPLFSFEQFMYVFEYLFNKYMDEEGNVDKYVQQIVLNVIRYRILKDKFYPYYLEGEEKERAYSRIFNIIKKIDNEVIMNYSKMDKFHKLYLINLKNEKITINHGFKSLYSIVDEKNRILINENHVEIVVDRIKFKNKKFSILGIVKSPILVYEKPELTIIEYLKDGNIIEKNQDLYDTVQSRYKTDIKVANFYRFEYQTNIENITKIKFEVKINNVRLNTNFFFNTWAPFNAQVGIYKLYWNDYKLGYKASQFFITKPGKKEKIIDLKNDLKKFHKINKRINIFRILAKITYNKNKRIWLYSDKQKVYDNAFFQYKHDVQIKDNIRKYYVVDDIPQNYKKLFNKQELKNVIKFGTLKHKLLFLNSDKIITSFGTLQDYCPLYGNFKYYKDILKHDLIYVQHGVLHAKLLKMYAKTLTRIDKFVVSSNFEKENLLNNYDYMENDIISTGMPRLDNEEKIEEAKNKIIYAPSWRKYLIGESIKRERTINIDKFIKSNYYKEIMGILNNSELINKLKSKNIILEFKLHPIFEPYKECFKVDENSNIEISIGNTKLDEYKLFITDFSSFQFDFVKIKRPILYFMPDMEDFKAGLHSYRELDLQYEEAFGKLCLTSNALVKEIITLIDNNFEIEKKYKQRMDEFFLKTKNNRENLYNILKKD